MGGGSLLDGIANRGTAVQGSEFCPRASERDILVQGDASLTISWL
jgi:hypothetical protein